MHLNEILLEHFHTRFVTFTLVLLHRCSNRHKFRNETFASCQTATTFPFAIHRSFRNHDSPSYEPPRDENKIFLIFPNLSNDFQLFLLFSSAYVSSESLEILNRAFLSVYVTMNCFAVKRLPGANIPFSLREILIHEKNHCFV